MTFELSARSASQTYSYGARCLLVCRGTNSCKLIINKSIIILQITRTHTCIHYKQFVLYVKHMYYYKKKFMKICFVQANDFPDNQASVALLAFVAF